MKNRNLTLNSLEGIACFAVVMLHCGFPGVFGKVIYGISRFAVPLFFAVSGYFVYSNDSVSVISKLPRKIKHIGLMFIATEILYFIWHCIQYSILTGGVQGVIEWIASLLTLENIFCFVIFQKTVIGDVSWFLIALILNYAVTFFIAKHNLWTKTFFLIPVLLLLNIILGEVLSFAGINTQWYWCSNFWVLGFPCYAIGYYIKINEETMKSKLTDKKIFIILIMSVGVNLVERAMTSASQLFFSNIPFMVCCFIYCLKYPIYFSNNAVGKALSKIGEEFAFGVYILHVIVRDILRMSSQYFGFSKLIIWNWFLPVMVFGFSITLYWMWIKGVEICRSKDIF